MREVLAFGEPNRVEMEPTLSGDYTLEQITG
jgi:hypothetical protein